jgi:peptidoglycan L-alanyl-D-glutamate endopeptidase CwlK
MKGNEVLRLKWIGSSFITFSLILIGIFLYVRLLVDPENIVRIDSHEPIAFPTELHPVVEERTQQLIKQSAEKGIRVVITDDFRSAEDQDRLYAKGRSAEGNIVTHAKGGESYHNFGLAVDFALKVPSGDVIWDMQYDGNANGAADWMEVVDTAKELGFEWGGDWAHFRDYPHLEMNFGLSIAQLQNGERPPDSFLTVEQAYERES